MNDETPFTSRWTRNLSIYLGIVLLWLFLSCVVDMLLFEVPFHLALGWVMFLGDVGPRISIDSVDVGSWLVFLVAASTGLHFATRRFNQPDRSVQSSDNMATKARPGVRQCVVHATAIVILFAAGTAFVGLLRQGIWMVTTDDDLVSSGRQIVFRVRSRNRMKQLGLALHNFESATGAFPPGGTFDDSGQGMHGWVTHLLPHLDLSSIGNQVVWNDPWTSDSNRPAMVTPIPGLLHPSVEHRAERAGPYAISHYAANIRVLGANGWLPLRDITDGSANTIIAGESIEGARAWGDPRNWRDPVAGINKPQGFNSTSVGGCQILLANGTVRFINENIDKEVLRNLSEPADGQLLGDF